MLRMEMDRIALLAAIALAAWQPSGAAPFTVPVNLLTNPSFEQGAEGNDEVARGWGLYQCGYTCIPERS